MKLNTLVAASAAAVLLAATPLMASAQVGDQAAPAATAPAAEPAAAGAEQPAAKKTHRKAKKGAHTQKKAHKSGKKASKHHNAKTAG